MSATEDHLQEVYDELRRMAGKYFRSERTDHTLQPTALVHEAYLRLCEGAAVAWQDRQHFFRVAARAMRRILVDHAKGHGRLKRGGDRHKLSLDGVIPVGGDRASELVALDDALERLAAEQPRKARIVELRYFGGLDVDETAGALSISPATVKREWAVARAWLARALDESAPADA